MDLGLEGRTAAVAAASRGLGRACAAALAAEGVRVAVCGRDRTRIEETAAELGPNAVGIVADLSDVGGAAGFVLEAQAALGGVDILVCNNGGPPSGTFATTGIDAYEAAFRANAVFSIAMCQTAVPAMRSRGWGRIVAITSVAVRQPIGDLILSNTARAGLTGFLKSLALEVAADGITVNSLLPGSHATERHAALHDDDSRARIERSIPAGSVGDPADFGAVCAFVCSEHARYLTGCAIPVDGGAYRGLL